jgi:hypothetical protein
MEGVVNRQHHHHSSRSCARLHSRSAVHPARYCGLSESFVMKTQAFQTSGIPPLVVPNLAQFHHRPRADSPPSHVFERTSVATVTATLPRCERTVASIQMTRS